MSLETSNNDSNVSCTESGNSEELLEKKVLNDDTNTVSNMENNSNSTVDENQTKDVEFKIIYNKKKIDVTFALDKTVANLKEHLNNIICIPPVMQKVMFKGLAKDDQTLRSLGVTKGAKVMIVGSKLDDILALSAPSKEELAEEAASAISKEPLSKQTVHRKVLDKGMPDDVLPGILDTQEPLPEYPLVGMLKKGGGKVRLTFKLELDQLWIGTKERTEKISMNSIKDVYNEPIHDHKQYHILALQLGPTEASRYYIYWVPAQYISAIKEAILGKWSYL